MNVNVEGGNPCNVEQHFLGGTTRQDPGVCVVPKPMLRQSSEEIHNFKKRDVFKVIVTEMTLLTW